MSVQTKSSAVEVAPARYKKHRHSYMKRTTTGEKVFSVFNYMILAVLGIVTLFPFYIVIMKSFAPPDDFINKTIIWWPSKFELTYYKFILGTKSDFMMALKNSVFLVTVGTATNVVATFVAACVLAQKKLPFRNQIPFNKLAIHTYMVYVPLLARYMDLPDVVSLATPNAIMVQQCTKDPLYHLYGMVDAVKHIQNVYETIGCPDQFKGVFYDTNHQFNVQMQEDAFTWFDEKLKS